MVDNGICKLQILYGSLLFKLLSFRWLLIFLFIISLGFSYPVFTSGKQIFLPKLDSGRIRVRISADVGTLLEDMDRKVELIENILSEQPETETVSTTVGGSIFGRTQRQTPTRSTIVVQLKPAEQHGVSSADWINRVDGIIKNEKLAGFRIRLSQRGIQGIRTGGGEEDISLRLQGSDLKKLKLIADDIKEKMREIPGLRNVYHTSQNEQFEMSISMDKERAVELGISLVDLTLIF